MPISDLPTLSEISAHRRATPKVELTTRLELKGAADRDDARQLEVWRKAVARRDRNRCRVCGCLTIATLELLPRRREIHHVTSRTCKVTRYDVRNGLTVCLKDHQRLTARRLFIIGTVGQMFQTGRTGRWYLDASCPLQFTEKHP